jgi:hypothetical protein
MGDGKGVTILTSRAVEGLTLPISSTCDNIRLTEGGCVELGIQSGGADCIAIACEDLPGARGDDKKVPAVGGLDDFEILLVKLFVPFE